MYTSGFLIYQKYKAFIPLLKGRTWTIHNHFLLISADMDDGEGPNTSLTYKTHFPIIELTMRKKNVYIYSFVFIRNDKL